MGSTRPRFPVCSQEARARRKRRKEPVVGGRAACSGKTELALHCRRRTRGAETTENLLNSLFATMAPATDMLGIPCSGKRCWARYGQSRKKHVGCIRRPHWQQHKGLQTPPGVQVCPWDHLVGEHSLHLGRFIPDKCADF